MAYDSYLTQAADGTSRITLADGTGSLVLAIGAEITEPPAATDETAPRGKHNPYRVQRIPNDDELVIAFVLSLN